MFNNFNMRDFESAPANSTNLPDVVFFPLKPLQKNNKKIEMLARIIPKYLSMRLERFNAFEIFYIYFLNKNSGSNEIQLSLPGELDDKKFISGYMTKLNIAFDIVFYGGISESDNGKISIYIKSHSKNSEKEKEIYSATFNLKDINNTIGKISNKVSLAADLEGDCLKTEEHESLLSCETSSFESLYYYFEVIDALTLRNPYVILSNEIIDKAFNALKHDENFYYLIDAIAFICDDYLRFGMKEKAAAVYDEAIKISRRAYKLYLGQAKLFLDDGRFEDAFKILRECINLNPDIGDVAYNYGKLALNMQKYEDAKFAFSKMIECGYKISSAYDNLGVMAAAENKTEDAINFWHKAIEFEPSKVSAYTNLARAYMELSDFTKAENYLQKAKILNPSYFMIYLNYFVLYKLKGDMREAEKNYKIALEYNPDLAITDEIRSELKKMINLIDSGNENEALNISAEINKITDKCWQAYFLSAIALRKSDRIQEAENNFLKAAQINPQFPDAQNELGLIYLSKGKFDDALMLFNNCVSLAPSNTGFLCNLGLCYIEMKNFEEAKNILYKAKYIRPDDVKINECIAYLNKRAGTQNDKNNNNNSGLKGFLNKIKNLFKK